MGEAAPPQPPTGSFVPLLGGVPGPGNGSRGSAVPQLHSAIVERLRARIELCRRHHTSCENRYQRGQAESSDRERESTLQLLNIVHQGPGSRKSKHGKAASQPQQALAPPPQSHEYNGRVNGEQKPQRPAGAPEEEHRNPTRIAVSDVASATRGNRAQKVAGEREGGAPLATPELKGCHLMVF
uniref:Neurogenic mastermind-like N-terminal domain-containing protein n=1 Tax=Erpetoichthys calabaricus TaxID=27687 RepID=A0A8C4S996_ERPCA